MNDGFKTFRAFLYRRAEWVALLLIVLGGAALRLAGIGAESVDLEEYACIGALHTRGLHHFLVEQRILYPYGAPLAPLLFYFWSGIFGVSIVSVRLLSALAGTVVILLPALLAREVWHDNPKTARTAGLIAALCVALSPVHLFQAQEARMYAFVALFAALSGLGLLRAVRTGGRRWWLLNLAANAALVWSHYFAAFLWPAQALWLLFARSVRWRTLLCWLAVHALLLVPVGLWMSGIAPQPKELHDYYIKPNLALVVRNLVADDAVHWSSSSFFPSGRAWFFAPDAVREAVIAAHPVGDAVIAVAFSAALLWSLLMVFRRRSEQQRLAGYLLLWTLVPLALLVALSLAWKPVYASRYLVHASLALYLLLGGLLARLPVSRRALCVTLLVVVFGWQLSLALPPQSRTAWKEAGAIIEAADGAQSITLIQGVFWKPIFQTNLASADAVVAAALEPESMAEMGAFLAEAIPALEPGAHPSCWAMLVDAIHGQAGRFEVAAAPWGMRLERHDFPGERRLDLYRISPAADAVHGRVEPAPVALSDLARTIADHASDPAIAVFQETVRTMPDVLGGGYLRLGVDLARRGRVALAAVVLDEAMARFPANLVDLVFLERALTGKGDIAPLADRAFARVKAVPERMPTLRQVLQSLLERGDADGVRDTAQQMIKAFPDYSQGYTYLALHDLDYQRLDDARTHMERAIALEPNQPARIYCSLADLYVREGRCSEAVTLLEQGLPYEPQTGVLVLKLAGAHNQCGDAARALELTTEMTQREPQAVDAHYERAAALMKLGKWEEAETESAILVGRVPVSQPFNLLAWRVLSHQGKDSEARQLLERLVATSPGGYLSVKGLVDALYEHHERAASLLLLGDIIAEKPLPVDVMETLNRLCPDAQPAAVAASTS